MGEAIVIRNNNLKTGFFTSIKMHGGLLAKGRILGIQFDTLFTNNLYFEIGTSAIECAKILKDGFKNLNLVGYIDSDTNQLFIVLDNNKYKELIKYVDVTYFGTYDKNNTIVRFVTSWATKKEDCYKLLDILEKL
jgi:threonine aldolase